MALIHPSDNFLGVQLPWTRHPRLPHILASEMNMLAEKNSCEGGGGVPKAQEQIENELEDEGFKDHNEGFG